MSVQDELRVLAARQTQEPPWNFEAFEQRRAHVAQQRRATAWSSALAVGALALVSAVAVLTQPGGEAPNFAEMSRAAGTPDETPADEQWAPALVDMGQFDITSTLEDHIAMLDAELSAARVQQVPEAQLRPIESAREQLSASLQRVTYAHSLLSL